MSVERLLNKGLFNIPYYRYRLQLTNLSSNTKWTQPYIAFLNKKFKAPSVFQLQRCLSAIYAEGAKDVKRARKNFAFFTQYILFSIKPSRNILF